MGASTNNGAREVEGATGGEIYHGGPPAQPARLVQAEGGIAHLLAPVINDAGATGPGSLNAPTRAGGGAAAHAVVSEVMAAT